MRLIDDENLVAVAGRRQGHGLYDDLTDVIDAGVRGRVHLEHVQAGRAGDLAAGVAPAARLGGETLGAIERLGQYARHRRLAHAAGAREKIGVVNLAGGKGVAQRDRDGGLSDHGVKTLRAVLAREDDIALLLVGMHRQNNTKFRILRTMTNARALVAAVLLAAPAAAADLKPPALWQEQYFFDALLQARDRAARTQSDPAMIPVLKAIAMQVAQQGANLKQIDSYLKTQQDNLRFAFNQDDPAASLRTIGMNFDTLAKGADQIRNNLYFLTVRCRIAASQALPDGEMYQATLLILGQVQQIQLQLNALYADAVEAERIVGENNWATSKMFRHQADLVTRSAVRAQDSVFSIYNAGYELAARAR